MSETTGPQETTEGPATFSWSPEIDYLLATWCDKAKCFEWMHTEAFAIEGCIRLAPPLNIAEEDLHLAMDLLHKAWKET